jgi:AraC-like DNA-binding protein
MNVVADTSLVPPAERFEYWADAAPRALLHPVGTQRLTDRPFSGRIVEHKLGPVTAYRMQGDASLVTLRAGSIESYDPERFSVAFVRSGRHDVIQEQRSATVSEGDLVAVHTSKPYAIRFETSYDVAVFVIDRVLLRPYSDRVCSLTAQRVSSERGSGRVVAGLLHGLADELDHGHIGPGNADLGESVVDAVRGLFAPTGTVPDERAFAPRAELLMKLRGYIEAELSDPSLGPEQIAREHFISVRYLYKLFENQGGVCSLIRNKRLDRCRRDLADPVLCEETVASIAQRWGFNDPGYFSRVFREAYQLSPTQYRRERAVGELPSEAEAA